jgi:hypothetical protein
MDPWYLMLDLFDAPVTEINLWPSLPIKLYLNSLFDIYSKIRLLTVFTLFTTCLFPIAMSDPGCNSHPNIAFDIALIPQVEQPSPAFSFGPPIEFSFSLCIICQRYLTKFCLLRYHNKWHRKDHQTWRACNMICRSRYWCDEPISSLWEARSYQWSTYSRKFSTHRRPSSLSSRWHDYAYHWRYYSLLTAISPKWHRADPSSWA